MIFYPVFIKQSQILKIISTSHRNEAHHEHYRIHSFHWMRRFAPEPVAIIKINPFRPLFGSKIKSLLYMRYILNNTLASANKVLAYPRRFNGP